MGASCSHRKEGLADTCVVTRKDESIVDNMNLQVHDDTAEATLGLWGTSAFTPFGGPGRSEEDAVETQSSHSKQPWKPGETVLLLQAPGWKIGRTTYLSLTSASLVDVNPRIPDTDWLRKFSLRQKSRDATNPPFPENTFDFEMTRNGPIRCLYTIAELDEFARAAPAETFQGYLNVLLMEIKLFEFWRRTMLLSGDCCNMAIYANAKSAKCKGCDKDVALRISPRILGQVIDETAAIAGGKLLFSDGAWRDLLGRGPEELLALGTEQMKYLSDRLLFCRVTLMFGWTGDETKAGGRICVMGVSS